MDKAKKEETLAWLYDEDICPSGPAGGIVTKDSIVRDVSGTLERGKQQGTSTLFTTGDRCREHEKSKLMSLLFLIYTIQTNTPEDLISDPDSVHSRQPRLPKYPENNYRYFSSSHKMSHQ